MSQPIARWSTAPVALLLFLLALAPRLYMPVDFLTVDEAYHWFERVETFRTALLTHDYAATLLVGHPGVTTLWLGAAGLELHYQFEQHGWLHQGLGIYHWMLRAPLAIVAAFCCALAYVLLRRLFGQRVALLAALIWAGEPFLIAHAQLLHVDSLLTSFSIVTLLLLLIAFRIGEPTDQQPAIRWPWLVAAGVSFGLSLLTKSPALIIGPTAILIGLVAWRTRSWQSWKPGMALVAWGAIACLVWVALWPAMWVAPSTALFSYFNEAIANGSSPHGWGNFFNGQAVDDPGLLFYPIALALRLSPWTLLGCIFGLIALLVAPRRSGHTAAFLLTSFMAIFVIVLMIMAKKFDRYALPVIPVLVILAAYGLSWLWDTLNAWLPTLRAERRHNRQVAWILLPLVLGVNLASSVPYPLSYYNPLLGGGAVASKIIPVGWGEGLEQAGAFIANQPDGCTRPIATFYAPVLRPFVCNRIVSLGAIDQSTEAGYAVLYVDQIQRGDRAEETAELQRRTPLKVIEINGIPYAYVYQLQPVVAKTTQAVFGSTIQLTGYTIGPVLASSPVITITTAWNASKPVTTNEMLFIHLFNQSGTRIGQVDVILGGADNPAQQWQPQRFQLQEITIPLMSLEEEIAWAAIGVYDQQTLERLPLRGTTRPTDAPDAGPNALLIRFDALSPDVALHSDPRIKKPTH